MLSAESRVVVQGAAIKAVIEIDLTDAFVEAVLRFEQAREGLRKKEWLTSKEVAERLGKTDNAFKLLYSRNASLRQLATELPGGLGWKWHDVEEWVRRYGRNTRARKTANAEAEATTGR